MRTRLPQRGCGASTRRASQLPRVRTHGVGCFLNLNLYVVISPRSVLSLSDSVSSGDLSLSPCVQPLRASWPRLQLHWKRGVRQTCDSARPAECIFLHHFRGCLSVPCHAVLECESFTGRVCRVEYPARRLSISIDCSWSASMWTPLSAPTSLLTKLRHFWARAKKSQI